MKTIPAIRATEGEPPEPEGPHGARSTARRALDRVLVVGAGGTALLMLGGLLISLVTLFALRHPYTGWSDNVVADAKAVATGHYQYGNPATHPVGAGYGPLYTWIFVGMLRVFWWEGWGPVVSILAIVGALVAVIAMIWTTTKGWEGRLATASFVVVVLLGGLSAFDPNGVYEARPDQLAWCLFVVAGTIVFRGFMSPDGLSTRKLLGIGALLACSILAKQPTLVACLVLAALTVIVPRPCTAATGPAWRTWVERATAPIVLVGMLAIVGLVLQATSDGYAYPLLVSNAFRAGRYIALRQEINWDLHRAAIPLAAFLIVAGCTAASMYLRRRTLPPTALARGGAAVVVAVCPIPTSILAAIKMGGNFNQLIGPVWALTLGAGVLLMLMQPSGRQLLASAIACCVLVVGLGVLPNRVLGDKTGKPALDQRNDWVGIDPFLQAAVDRGEAVYDWNVPSLSVSKSARRYPAGDWVDRFAAGYTPRYFIDNLLDGRYALVAPMPVDTVSTNYWSGLGRYDALGAWKMNLLLGMAYDPVKDPYSGSFYYAPTSQLPKYKWFAQCFGPYAANAADVGVRVRGTGGLVCVDHGNLRLTQAPYPTTTLVAALGTGGGTATLHFAAPPTALALTPLNGADTAPSANASAQFAPVVNACLGGSGTAPTLTLRAVRGTGDWVCRPGDDGPILDIPASGGGAAHVAIDLAAADAPTLTASTSGGQPAPFVVANPNPA